MNTVVGSALEPSSGLTKDQVEHFIEKGFIRLDDAFPRSSAALAREQIWKDLPGRANNPATWTQSVVVRSGYWQQPFKEAANTPRLYEAFDALVGRGRWERPKSLGSFVMRFPGGEEDFYARLWHADASFPPPDFCGPIDEHTDYSKWRVNVRSRGRALLMLFLFSDVGENDAPTRLSIGSHFEVARLLAPHGEAGLRADMDVSGCKLGPEALATGPAGTVYLCHPFLLHAGQPHRGNEPRFMAQPGLLPARGHRRFRVGRPDGYPVERAIFRALAH